MVPVLSAPTLGYSPDATDALRLPTQSLPSIARSRLLARCTRVAPATSAHDTVRARMAPVRLHLTCKFAGNRRHAAVTPTKTGALRASELIRIVV